MIHRNWMSVWYSPEPGEVIAFMTVDQIARVGGSENHPPTAHEINHGNALLAKWCRVNCKNPGRPVNVRGRTGWAFRDSSDAIIFKLTWC